MGILKDELHDFDVLWALEAAPVEQGNVKKSGGHSSVMHFTTEDAAPLHVYMKKQQNYATALSRWLMKPRSVCSREYANIQAWHQLGLPTMDAVYCGEKHNPLRGILITVALDGYVPLDEYLKQASDQQRVFIVKATGALIRRIHQAGWVHRCCYPKHVFVCLQNPAQLKMIDLEKARKAWWKTYDRIRDLAAFDRRMDWQNDAERELFFSEYVGTMSSTVFKRCMMNWIDRRNVKKGMKYI